ncbi:amidohydrolase family protein [Desulfococcus sp.]|uniref:amidohydrolase family protein n=1 Tax=Desulfococcus sp. TaxID=2025834 RepID=UPI003593E80F
MKFDLIIHNGTLITVNAGFDIIPNGIVCVRNGTIAEVSERVAGAPLPPAAETIDARGGIVMPGLVNTHTHLPMTLFRGLADDLPLMDWLNGTIFPAEAAHIRPETAFWGAQLACAEMILAGTTTCCDGYFHEDAVARAVQASGMRAVLGQGVIDFPAPGVPDPDKNIEQAERFVETWQGAGPLISAAVFCHSPYTCSGETLKRAKSLARRKNVLFQIHTAETRTERDQSLKAHGASPVRYLDDLGLLDAGTLLVHAVWTDAADVGRIAKTGAAISHNPESNMKLASGIAPVGEYLAAGIRVGLGTDGCASNNNLDLFQEMDTAAKLHKVSTLDPTVMDARTVIRMATAAGADAIGLGEVTGSLEIGKQADVIILDTATPHMTPLYHPASQIVYAAKASDVRTVIVGGRVLMSGGNIATLDLERISTEIDVISHRIKERQP